MCYLDGDRAVVSLARKGVSFQAGGAFAPNDVVSLTQNADLRESCADFANRMNCEFCQFTPFHQTHIPMPRAPGSWLMAVRDVRPHEMTPVDA
jgi:hypothetical protein